ncbi:MAG: GNAT family N-acetyltransferase, partial [Rhodopila sp.]
SHVSSVGNYVVAAYDVTLSGIGEQSLTAARRAADLVVMRRSQKSPFVDLAAIRRSGGDYLAGRSANTRQQLRRSNRFYERDGPIGVEHATSVESAHAMLDQMATLQQAVWQRRGKPGSFAPPFFRQFHTALIEAAFPRQEVTVARISILWCDNHWVFV